MNYITLHPFISLAAGFSAAFLILGLLVMSIHLKWRAVFGKKAKTSAEVTEQIMQRLARLEERAGGLEPRVNVLEEIARVSIQKVGFKRFNPFNDTGGDQSFAIAVLDYGNNGFIVSSLYTREGVRTYAKRIENGVAKHQLSEEEKMVLQQAIES